MKALTLCHPHADRVMRGEKVIENRTWRAPAAVIGQRIAIHAGVSRKFLTADDIADRPQMVFGAVIATAKLAACLHLSELRTPLSANPDANGPWCWLLEDVEPLETPVPARGALGLWEWKDTA